MKIMAFFITFILTFLLFYTFDGDNFAKNIFFGVLAGAIVTLFFIIKKEQKWVE